MCADHRGIDKEVARQGAVLHLEPLPEPAPEPARFPTAKAVGHRVPVPKVLRQVTPWRPGPCEIQDSLDKQPIAERRRAAGAGFQGSQEGRNFRPRLVREQ